MKRLHYYLSGVFLLCLFISCQKEKSFETTQSAKGSLQSEATGDCLPKTIAGAYVAGKTLTDSNFIEVEVNVTATGPYTIATDSVNGYAFKGSGTFSATGANKIQLKGSGKPLVVGTDNFVILFDSTSCLINVTVLPAGNSGGPATFTLQGTGSSCINATPSGSFVKGVALTSSSSLSVQVNVTRPGTYTITTNTVNGFSFSATGSFAAAGIQPVTLTPTGTPLVEGPTAFTVTAGSSTCTTLITVTATAPPPPVTSTDYFPLTQNSFWTYDDGIVSTDTIKTTVNGTGTFNAKTYQRFITADNVGPFDTAFYRKDVATGFYYNYVNIQDLVDSGFSFPQPGIEVLFLKETLATGDTWNSDNTGTFSGFPVTIRFKFTCVNANAAITVNTHSFTSVYQISMQPQSGVLGTFTDADKPTTFYYAKGIGLIKLKYDTDEQDIRFWKVN